MEEVIWLLLIVRGADGGWYQVFANRLDDRKVSFFALECNRLCHKDLKRFHLTCLTSFIGLGCRCRRMFYGLMPKVIPVEAAIVQVSPVVDGKMHVWRLWIQRNARFARVKRVLIKRLLPWGLKFPRFKPFFTCVEVFLAN